MCRGLKFSGKSQRTVDKLRSSTVPCQGTSRLIYNRGNQHWEKRLFYSPYLYSLSASLATVDVNWCKIWHGCYCTVSRNGFQSFHTSFFYAGNLHSIPATPAVSSPLLLYCIKILYTDLCKLQMVGLQFELYSHKIEFICTNGVMIQTIFSSGDTRFVYLICFYCVELFTVVDLTTVLHLASWLHFSINSNSEVLKLGFKFNRKLQYPKSPA